MNIYKNIRSVMTGLLMASAACAPPPPAREVRIIPLSGNDLASVSGTRTSGSLARDGIEVRMTPVTRQEMESWSLILKPVRYGDIEQVYSRGYVNHTDSGNAELLGECRLAGTYPYRGRFDSFEGGMAADGWRMNPFLDAQRDILVFRVTIDNRSSGRVAVYPARSVLLDGRGGRLEPLRQDDWNGFAPLAVSPGCAVVTGCRDNTATGYFIPRSLLPDREEAVALDGVRAYPGTVLEGLLVFPGAGDGVREFSVVLPEVEFYDQENEIIRKRDFTCRFLVAEIPKP